jgi:ceramide glucosyltransferase
VSARGYRLALSNEVVDTVLALGSWHHLFQHQLRWARTYRLYRPGGYFGSILTHGTFWALANLLYNHFSPIAWATSAVVIGARYVVAGVFSWHHLKTETAVSQMLLVGAKDLFATAVWFLAFAGDTVEWGGNRFRVDRFGEMTDLAATESSLAWNDVGPKVEETARIAND